MPFYTCKCCAYTTNRINNVKKHTKTKKHQRNVLLENENCSITYDTSTHDNEHEENISNWFELDNVLYICDICSYKTRIKCNFKKHMQTKKHKVHEIIKLKKSTDDSKYMNYEDEDIVDENGFYICKYCAKKFKHRQGMYRHIKYTCKKNDAESINELVRLMNMKIDTERDEFKTEIQKRDKAIEHLARKLDIADLGGNRMTANTINNIMNNSNNTVTNNIQNNIQIVNYKDSDLSTMSIKQMGIIYSKYTNCTLQCCAKFIVMKTILSI